MINCICGGMKLKYNTKVQTTGGTLSTSIPKVIRDILEIEKGDSVQWEVDLETRTVTMKKLE